MTPYQFSEDAFLDFVDIFDQLNQQSSSAASRFTFKLDQQLRLFAKFPDMGLPRPDLERYRYKYFLVAPYLIAYDPKTRPLRIVGIRHGSQALNPFPRS